MLISVLGLPDEYDLLVEPHDVNLQGAGEKDEVRIPHELHDDRELAIRLREVVAVGKDSKALCVCDIIDKCREPSPKAPLRASPGSRRS